MGGPPPPPMYGAPPPEASPRPPDERHIFFGSLKAVSTEKGWGHIDCQPLKKLYGKDMFVMKSSLEGQDIAVGQQVRFSVTQGPKGPHAVNITPVSDGQSSTETFTGTVKNFNEQKGWGFIESEKSKEIYGQDIFLHKKELSDISLKVGEEVHFSVDISGGRPVAKNILLIGS